ncbi:15468_t:CDS:1, partial [Cetraspora pellucida]
QCVSPTCDPCLSSCSIPYPPSCNFRTMTTTYYSYYTYTSFRTATTTATTTRYNYYTYTEYARSDSALIGTSISLGIVSGIILPICIAFIFYYRRHALATQSEQNPEQNGTNNQNPGVAYFVREYGTSE